MTGHVVTYGQFAALAKAQGWVAQFLAERFRGKIESPSEFFHRLIDPEKADCAIPYLSVLEFYLQKIATLAKDPKQKSCACGCGRPLFGRKKLATGYCRVKMSRKRSAAVKSGIEKSTADKALSVIKGANPEEW